MKNQSEEFLCLKHWKARGAYWSICPICGGFFSGKTIKMAYFIFKLKYLGVFCTWYLPSCSQNAKDRKVRKACEVFVDIPLRMITAHIKNFNYLISYVFHGSICLILAWFAQQLFTEILFVWVDWTVKHNWVFQN